MKLYSLEAVNKAAAIYEAKGGSVRVVREGTLLDDIVMEAPGLKTIVCLSKYLNANSSAYIIKQYNVTPKKYAG